MFRLYIQDIEEFVDLHETVLKAVHNLDKADEEKAVAGIRKSLRRVFNTQGFGQWPALSNLYEKWKNEEAPGKPMMRLEDDYYQAATRKGHPGNKLERSQVSDDYYSIAYTLNEDWFSTTGSGLVEKGFFYPALHEQEGGTEIYNTLTGKTYQLPERPVFRLAESDAALRADILKAYRANMVNKLANIHGGGRVPGRPKVTRAEKAFLLARPERAFGTGVTSGSEIPF